MERQLLVITEKAGDDGTNDMINRFMQFKEKTPGCCARLLMRINYIRII
ncbi:hypothetical protein [Mucilaginibacter panaciglaebae]